MTTSDALGVQARDVLIDIFRKKDVTAVDLFFGEPFVQHDPNLADGIAGMKSLAAEIASSPAADIPIFRTLVDGDLVALHSRYEGLESAPGPLLAFDVFRFEDDMFVEHWGGQQAESSTPNLSGHTQVDGPTSVEDREKTEANRALIRTYRQAITVEQQYGRIDDFLTENYIQHAEGFGDGVARLKARYAGDVKPGTSHVLTPRYFVVDGNLALSVVDAKTDPPRRTLTSSGSKTTGSLSIGRCCQSSLRRMSGRTRTDRSTARSKSHSRRGTPVRTVPAFPPVALRRTGQRAPCSSTSRSPLFPPVALP
jgi:predicted SnoaL-like aldol condensation-catalyzing enzyme